LRRTGRQKRKVRPFLGAEAGAVAEVGCGLGRRMGFIRSVTLGIGPSERREVFDCVVTVSVVVEEIRYSPRVVWYSGIGPITAADGCGFGHRSASSLQGFRQDEGKIRRPAIARSVSMARQWMRRIVRKRLSAWLPTRWPSAFVVILFK